jgi:hypothetical protein
LNDSCFVDDGLSAPNQKMEHDDKRIYLSNPAVTPTALGHSSLMQQLETGKIH